MTLRRVLKGHEERAGQMIVTPELNQRHADSAHRQCSIFSVALGLFLFWTFLVAG